MCPDSLSPDSNQPSRDPLNSGQSPDPKGSSPQRDDFSQFVAALPTGAQRLVCTRDMYQPMAITFPADNPDLIANALRNCGHEIGQNVIEYLTDSLRLGTPLSGEELLDFGLALEHVHVGERRDIGALAEQKPTLSREVYILFLEPPDTLSDSGHDAVPTERLLDEAKLVFEFVPDRPDKLQCSLRFNVGDYDQDSVDLRWEIASIVADALTMRDLPERMPVVVPPGEDEAQPIFYHDGLSFDLELMDPDRNATMKQVEEINRDDPLDEAPDQDEVAFGDFDPVTGEFIPEPAETFDSSPESFRLDTSPNRKIDLQGFWRSAIVYNMTPDELYGIMSASGIAGITPRACRDLVDAVVISKPIELDRFGFINDEVPLGLKQEIDYWFDAKTGAYFGRATMTVEVEDPGRCAGFEMTINTVTRDSEQRATTEAIMAWQTPEQISATGKWQIVSLATKSGPPLANRG